jgi:hypothetical protein
MRRTRGEGKQALRKNGRRMVFQPGKAPVNRAQSKRFAPRPRFSPGAPAFGLRVLQHRFSAFRSPLRSRGGLFGDMVSD